MYVKQLTLANFRNYTRLEIDLPARVNVLQGENAQGKTNILEAIYYLATTRTPLASSDRQLINWAADEEVIPYADLSAVFVRAGREHRIDATLVTERIKNGGEDRERFRRRIQLDSSPRRAIDVVGNLTVVLFLPEDIALVSGGPSERRRYLDVTLCQVDGVYCRSLSRYNRALAQRNALLKQIREGSASTRELGYWDAQLAELGAYVLWKRLWAARVLSHEGDSAQRSLTGEREGLGVEYVNSLVDHLLERKRVSRERAETLASEYTTRDAAGIAQLISEALQAVRPEEMARGVTVVGPHRDDLRFLINGIDATIYGSRGQQRTVALALKMAEVNLIRGEIDEMPVLLLDDVLSELDQRRCLYLLDTVLSAEQVLLTTTDLDFYTTEFLANAQVWSVAAGTVTPKE